MTKVQWRALIVALCFGFGCYSARADDVLEVDGQQLRWEATASARKTIVTYALLQQNFTVPQTNTTLSRDNCGAMEPFDAIISATRDVTSEEARRELTAALAAWEGVTNVEFVEVFDAHTANIVVGASTAADGKAFANLSYRKIEKTFQIEKALGKTLTQSPPQPLGLANAGAALAIEQAYVCLNSRSAWKIGFDGKLDVYDLRYTFTHELGHAIGLDHPGRSGSVMAFRYDEQVGQLQPSDIKTVQSLYGPKRQSANPAHEQLNRRR